MAEREREGGGLPGVVAGWARKYPLAPRWRREQLLSLSTVDGVSGWRRGLLPLSAVSRVWLNTTSGLAAWLPTTALACSAMAANAAGSARGWVNRR